MDRLWTRPDTFRLLMRVDGAALDADGNARSADVRYLDRTLPCGEMSWFAWHVGDCLHWSPFRLALLDTRRAGLHVVSEVHDAAGRWRYGGNHQIAADGILVLSPCNVARLAEPLDEALADGCERDLLDSALRSRLGLNATDTRPTRRLWRLPLAVARETPGTRGRHPLAAPVAA